ncbi:proton extrusion protein PcxA [Gloeothece verrucosa]|uniref:Proton extrusion protein PxcA n=1 Tax=Gloeothece verrucosa (strain PCC 7822) TaxID=497965 RepID=E0UEQ1_GLOV7|nr:proton extrusion protein PcxA [Gloeothece verrucosa]ADN16619.1 CemA family protein [Gloeothece verrucosa PCC 7822]
MKLSRIVRGANQWLSKTPERALDQAYRAAFKIREIENKHFQGKKVSVDSAQYGDSVMSYFLNEVQGYLQTIRVRLSVFKASRLFMTLSEMSDSSPANRDQQLELEQAHASLLLQKLQFIDEVTSKYKDNDFIRLNASKNANLSSEQWSSEQALIAANGKSPQIQKSSTPLTNIKVDNPNRKLDSAVDKTGALPRSFLNTLNRIKQEIDPKSEESEEAVLKRFRSSRYQTAISIKFILLLIIVPLLTHQITKTFLLTPIVHNYFGNHEQVVFINKDLEEEAFAELKTFEESLHFKSMIGLIPKLTEEEIEEQVKNQAKEISEAYRYQGIDAIANIFADLFSFLAFVGVLVSSRKEIEIVKSFMDSILYSLSDSAKAFLIILFTDMFVGFHSPHGWEVILEGVARHFGLPENRDFNFLFIATFPVILDTVLKYWIFRYLNRISPSAVATYRNMNE